MGDRIRRLRVARGYRSQGALGREVARRLGRKTPITKATVSKWEKGITTYIREVGMVAEVLGTDVPYLRWGEDRSPMPIRAPYGGSSRKGGPGG